MAHDNRLVLGKPVPEGLEAGELREALGNLLKARDGETTPMLLVAYVEHQLRENEWIGSDAERAAYAVIRDKGGIAISGDTCVVNPGVIALLRQQVQAEAQGQNHGAAL